jgi:DNA polymerase-3 subunit alpha
MERFPDIDQDLCGKDRAEIKAYMETRFGKEQVCSIGTFSTFRPKGLIKDLARNQSIDFSEVNLITSMFWDADTKFIDVIRRSCTEPKLKSFIKKNSDIFNMLPTLLDQQKTQSIHACAMVVFPSVMTANEWAPMRMQQGLMVSEWCGGELDDAGFLKEDILGIKQLDKFTSILKLIEENGKEVPDIYNLPHDREVYRYFGNGWNGDVFQFGTASLSEFTRSMKPQGMNDLIAANALYRPGPLEMGFHHTYVKCKNEGKMADYLWGTEEITRETFGLLVYQEQIMKVFQDLGGLTMKEADDVRRAIGKKKMEDIKLWKSKVETECLKNGCTEKEFKKLWETIIEFARYSFNKSHSTAYAMTGYISQYLKVKYPIEYWTTALDYGGEKDIMAYLSEILQSKQIEVKPPDVNKSGSHMTSDQETSTIFWGIESIKGIGETAAIQIITERKANGPYKSFADFYFRHTFKGSKVNKRAYEALIGCGAFDELYKFNGEEERRRFLLKRYRTFKKVKVAKPERDPYSSVDINHQWWWKLQQKSLIGLASIDYEQICEDMEMESRFCSISEFNQMNDKAIFRSFGGFIVECKIGKTKKGKYARLTLEHNYKMLKLIIWPEQYEEYAEQLKNCEKKIIIFDGDLKYDAGWSKSNQFTIKNNSSLIVL